jgi:predicted solute-binding protein
MSNRIPLTQDMLDAGHRWSVYMCPVALALRTKYSNSTVGEFYTNIGYKLSEKLQTLIRQFDDGKPIAPCTLVIKDGILDYEN